MKTWRDYPIKTILATEREFPERLRAIHQKPKKLDYRGEWDENIFGQCLAVVGSRRMSRYGREVLEKFIPPIVAGGVTIVSGFMYGIDGEAHRLCLDSGGRTIAVLGGGLDFLSPIQNDSLYGRILESGGLVLSEYDRDFRPRLWTFPQRNRIVAGLSNMGVLVVEASLKSGSLITAEIARKEGKPVFAIPGTIEMSNSSGTNWLIKEGRARLVSDPEDILGQKRINIKQERLFPSLDEIEERIVDSLRIEDLSADELSTMLKIPIDEISVRLSVLTLKNIVNEEAGKIYLVK